VECRYSCTYTYSLHYIEVSSHLHTLGKDLPVRTGKQAEWALDLVLMLRCSGVARFFGAPGKKKLWPYILEITNCKGITVVY
jgi:hypothetical protein